MLNVRNGIDRWCKNGLITEAWVFFALAAVMILGDAMPASAVSPGYAEFYYDSFYENVITYSDGPWSFGAPYPYFMSNPDTLAQAVSGNAVSSIAMTAGWSVSLYTGINFTGSYACLNSSVSFLDFDAPGFNDNVRSFRVFNVQDCEGGYAAALCGNGSVEFAEACDDGNSLDGDCCNSSCQYEASDSPCTSDAVSCTTDTCDATGVCQHAPINAACDDGVACTTDACSELAGCQHTANDAACDDSIACTTDTCSDQAGCQHAANDAACDDGNACDGTEICAPGIGCQAGTPPSCNDSDPCTQDSCDMSTGCVNRSTPAVVCTNSVPGKAQLTVHKDVDPAKDKVQFKWSKGSFDFSAFGDPLATTGYTLCVYDNTGGIVGMTVPASTMLCGTKPCWSEKGTPPTSIAYKDSAKPPTSDGVKIFKGKAGTAGKAKLKWKAQGSSISTITMGDSLSYPVIAQVVTTDASCWEADFTAVEEKTNDGTTFKAAYPAP